MTIVDAHHHVWDLSVRDQPWLAQSELAPLRRNFALSDLKPQAVAQGVTATVLVQTVTEPEETPEMLALAAADDLVVGVVGWVDLEAPAVQEAVTAFSSVPRNSKEANIGRLWAIYARHPESDAAAPRVAAPAKRKG